jgi:MoaA/NifB/PqqE/SkfB family radical SAM enzyme
MQTYKLEHCVWETTLRCNLHCRHCGSKAGQARGKELSFKEAVKMFSQLAFLGHFYGMIFSNCPLKSKNAA